MQCHAHALCTVRFDGAQLAAPAGFQRCTLQGDSTHTLTMHNARVHRGSSTARLPGSAASQLERRICSCTPLGPGIATATCPTHMLSSSRACCHASAHANGLSCTRTTRFNGQTAAKPLVMPAVAVGTLETRRCKAKGPAAGAPPCQHHELTSDSCLMRKTTPHTNTAPHRPARQARFGDNRHSATLQHMARHAVRVPAQCLSKLHHADPRATLTAHRMTLHMASRLAPMC